MNLSNQSQKKLLIAEDDEIYSQRLARAFADRGIETSIARCLDEVVDLVSQCSYDYAVIDLRLGYDSGLAALKCIKEANQSCAAVILTGFGTINSSVEAIKLGAINYLTKPTDPDAILESLQAIRKTSLEKRSCQKLPTLGQIEWQHIQNVLLECSGNVSQAAKVLGIHRRSLQRKLQKNPGEII